MKVKRLVLATLAATLIVAALLIPALVFVAPARAMDYDPPPGCIWVQSPYYGLWYAVC